MARRRMVIRKIDPFSVLKFGAVAHLALAAIGFVALSIVTRVVLGSGIVEQICEIASDVGFLECGIDQGRITRLLIVLGLVWAVVQTALVVLLAFLHNLVADLTGGIAVVMDIDTPPGGARPAEPNGPGMKGGTPPPVVARPGPAGPNDQTTTVEPVDAIEAVVQPRPKPRPQGEAGGRLFSDRR